jgi:PAS domain S-box-containing protein
MTKFRGETTSNKQIRANSLRHDSSDMPLHKKNAGTQYDTLEGHISKQPWNTNPPLSSAADTADFFVNVFWPGQNTFPLDKKTNTSSCILHRNVNLASMNSHIQEVFLTGRPKQIQKTSPGNRTSQYTIYSPLHDESGQVGMVAEFYLDIPYDAMPEGDHSELKKLVENRTRQFAKTSEQLVEENVHRQLAEKTLNRRNNILEAVNYTAQQLIIEDNWHHLLSRVLKRLGEATDACKAYAYKIERNSKGHREFLQLQNWTKPGVTQNLQSYLFNIFSNKTERSRLFRKLAQGRPVYGSAPDFPQAIQEKLDEAGIKSIAIIPISIQGKLWGGFGLEHCSENNPWSQIEIETLMTAATLFQAAIHHQKLLYVLEESRSRYRAVVDDQYEMICRYQSSGRVTFVNDAFCDYFNKNRSDLIGNSIFSLFTDSEIQKIKNLTSRLSPQIPKTSFVTHKELANGREQWQKWYFRGIFNLNGSLIEYQVVGQDITEQKRAEETLKKILDDQEVLLGERTNELQLANKWLIQNEKMASLGLLISGIAHEINNPNNFISFNIPILKDYLQELFAIADFHANDNTTILGMPYTDFKEDIFKLLGNVTHGTERINAIISRLREFSRPKKWDELHEVDVVKVIRQSVELCYNKVMKKVKTLLLDLPEDGFFCTTNANGLEQALINLLINCSQAADKKNAWIKISLQRGTTDKDTLIIMVADNGCGMDKTTKDKIFDPFFSTKGPEGGTGLGLYISQKLIGGLEGRIEVDSQKGKGSCFRIILPDLSHHFATYMPNRKNIPNESNYPRS